MGRIGRAGKTKPLPAAAVHVRVVLQNAAPHWQLKCVHGGCRNHRIPRMGR